MQKRAIKKPVFIASGVLMAYNISKQMIKISIVKRDKFMNLERIYNKIAKGHGVGASEIRQAIQAAIIDAYTNPPDDSEAVKAYQKCIPCKGSIPTPEELITYHCNAPAVYICV